MSLEATVFVVDDDPDVRAGIRDLIQSLDMKIETYASGREFLDAYDPSRPGCLVLDIRMPDLSGVQIQSEFAEKDIDIPIIFITGHGDVPMAVRAMQNGAIDFLEKPFREQVLLDRIHQAISKDQQTRRQKAEFKDVQARYAMLTPKARVVMNLAVLGKSSRRIAAELGLSPKTIHFHLARILDTMQVDTTVELARLAITSGIVGQATDQQVKQ